MKKKKKYNTSQFIVGVILVLIIIIGYSFYNKSTENYNHLKIDSSKYLVYTESETSFGNYYQYKPYLNIKGPIGTAVNENITAYVNSFAKENICITYEYDLNGKVLSLVLKVEDHSYVESATILYFRSYNINLDTQDLLSNDTLLSLFDTTSYDVQEKLNQKIYDYYHELVTSQEIDSSECDFHCFQLSRSFQDGIDDVEYFVRDGKLVVFKPYIYMEGNSNIKYDFEIDF